MSKAKLTAEAMAYLLQSRASLSGLTLAYSYLGLSAYDSSGELVAVVPPALLEISTSAYSQPEES